MNMEVRNDMDLLERAKRLAGGTQQLLAERLGVTPSAISNWLALGRIPDGSRRRIEEFLGAGVGRDRAATPVGGVPVIAARPHVPAMLEADAERCGYFGRAAWSFNYIVEPERRQGHGSAEIWRTWNRVTALRSTIFRHYFRYRSFDGDEALMEQQRGVGFLQGWRPEASGEDEYRSVSATLSKGPHENGGFHILAKNSILPLANSATGYEFVGFRPECPVETTNVVISIPSRMRGNGPMVSYVVGTDYAQHHALAAALTKNKRVEDLIAPWGEQIPVTRLRSEQLDGEADSWSSDWPADANAFRDAVLEKFQPTTERDVYVATSTNQSPLSSLIVFWPLPGHA